MRKNTVVEGANLRIKKFILKSSNLIFKIRTVVSRGPIHRKEGYKIEIKRFFWSSKLIFRSRDER